MIEAKLHVRGVGDPGAEACEPGRVCRNWGKIELAGIDKHEAVAIEGGVDAQIAETGNGKGGIEPVGKGGEIVYRHADDLAILALGFDMNQPARGLQR